LMMKTRGNRLHGVVGNVRFGSNSDGNGVPKSVPLCPS